MAGNHVRRLVGLTVSTVLISAGLSAVAPTAATAPIVDPATVELTLPPGGATSLSTRVVTPEIPPNPDIVFLADTTGGMDPVLANVRNNGRVIIDSVRAVQPNARFAVAEYKEERDGPGAFRIRTPMTNDDEMVLAGMGDWLFTVGGGGAPWTDFINAFHQISSDKIAFRPTGTRIVVWFGDAQSHDPSLGHTLSSTIAAMQAQRIRVVAIPVLSPTSPGLDSLGQATSITSATNGRLMPDQQQSEVAAAIQQGLRALRLTVTPRTSCDPQLSVAFDAPSRTVAAGTAAEYANTVRLSQDAAAGSYRCTVDYLIGDVSAGLTQTITVHAEQPPDTTGPSISITVSPGQPDGLNGWYKNSPRVTFNCSDPSGVASCSPPVRPSSSAQPQTITGTATDSLGNTSSASISGLKIDDVAPSVGCGPQPTYPVGASAVRTATVTDAHSGPAAPSVSAPVDTSSAGTFAVPLTGTDVAGNSRTQDCSYQVSRAATKLVANPAKLGLRLLTPTLSVSATLSRADTAVPPAGEQINFTVGSRTVCTATTDVSGRAACTGPANWITALFQGYTATFAGTPALEPATAKGRVG